MNKKDLSERDICTKYIHPALTRAGWDIHTQIREEYSLTAGRVIVRGRQVTRGQQKRADYVLFYKPGIPLAVIEAKDNNAPVGGGIQQALEYADLLKVPFAYASNGDGFVERDGTGHAKQLERTLSLDEFPSPDELWRRHCKWKGITGPAEQVVAQDYHTDGTDKAPRYYQLIAINRVVEAVAREQRRILLVMATGTGKTYTAFQIVWRLWKAGVKKRILFLADRNILVDQTKTNDFKPFGQAMTKITDRKVDKSFEIYLALYQAVSGAEEQKDIFRQFSRDFFDLVIIDECHRGSAADNSAWREILDYFDGATQLGLTATPKETTDISTTHYFGDPVYTYSLKQGIEDGYLAPYKVIRFDIDKDLEGWRPTKGKRDKLGQEIEDCVYQQRDYDRSLVLERRTQLVAQKVSDYLKATDRFAKTIVFCEDIDHANRMRGALTNENADLVLESPKYVWQITGDRAEYKAELDNFIDPEKRYPVVVTTSKLLSTGVDAQTCKVIALDQNIQSLSEFKQIVGRGTRLREDYGKMFFTILDFRRATEHFADPDFDGNPVQVYQPRGDDPVVPPDEGAEASGAGPDEPGAPSGDRRAGDESDGWDKEPRPGQRRRKYVVADVPVYVVKERVQYYGDDGKLIDESLRDYSRRAVLGGFASLDAFLQRWTEAERKKYVTDELLRLGVFLDDLAAEVGQGYSPFDIVAQVAFGHLALTRKQRVERVRQGAHLAPHPAPARAVLEALLTKYEEGVDDIGDLAILKVAPLTAFGTPREILGRFGGRDAYVEAVRALEMELYRAP